MFFGKKYPLHHCTKCGCFFKDAKGAKREGLRGQQSKVVPTVCAFCRTTTEGEPDGKK